MTRFQLLSDKQRRELRWWLSSLLTLSLFGIWKIIELLIALYHQCS